jgi:N-hydroxyarylamine O-acetyltransferase
MRMTCTRALPDIVNVDAYLERIGYTGPRTATLETLAAIHLHHPQAIPFENLDPLLKQPIRLSAEAFERKMLQGRRGGWCFEHNLLLSNVLQSIGFRVTGLAARVMWNAVDAAVRARSHMLLRIDRPAYRINGESYIADVGFGGLTLTAPLRLTPDVEQTTPHETFRLIETGGEYILQGLIRDIWKSLYRFDLQPQLLPDYEVWSWHLANHPESPFVNNLMAARVASDRRYGLLNNKLSIHHLHSGSEQITLGSVTEMRRTLEDTFGIRLPDDPGMDSVLARLIR